MFERRDIKSIYLELSVKIKIDKNSIFADASAASQQPAK